MSADIDKQFLEKRILLEHLRQEKVNIEISMEHHKEARINTEFPWHTLETYDLHLKQALAQCLLLISMLEQHLNDE